MFCHFKLLKEQQNALDKFFINLLSLIHIFPEYLNEYLEKYHDILMESVAETSEEFMDRYFEGDEFSVTEVRCV